MNANRILIAGLVSFLCSLVASSSHAGLIVGFAQDDYDIEPGEMFQVEVHLWEMPELSVTTFCTSVREFSYPLG